MCTTNTRHAYLIMAHTNFKQLQILIDLLDDERNDIYLHIDKKAKTFPQLKSNASHLYFVEQIDIVWGSYNQIQCEMILIEAAAKVGYQYYHLLSGMDLPLKTQDTIHSFFTVNAGKEFLSIDEDAQSSKKLNLRTEYYHVFGDVAGNGRDFFSRTLRVTDRILVYLQKALHIRRESTFPLYKGANWFSITHNLVCYLLSHKDAIEKQFSFSSCADEVFLQSVAMASPFRDNIVNNTLRAIDWTRGRPYVYRKEDVSTLLASEALWARKFDQRIDEEAIKIIASQLNQMNQQEKQQIRN